MRKASIWLFLTLMFFQTMASNMAHPVTPAFLQSLGMPNYMFGVAFAAMSLTNFLLCPFWGSVGDSIGRVKTIGITTFGYALGQVFFLFSSNIPMLIFARMFAGAFSGGYLVSFMAYVADISEENVCSRNMTYYAALTMAGTSCGYLVGGVLGDISVYVSIIGQILVLISTGLLFLLLMKDGENYQKQTVNLREAANPFASFLRAGKLITPAMAVFLVMVFASCFSTTAYDNSFNYYIRDQFGFPTSYNGLIYAASGIMGLIVNFTLNNWLVRRTDCRKSVIPVLACASMLMLSASLIRAIAPFIAVNLIFYVFNSMYLPIQQVLMVKNSGASNGVFSGVFTSSRSMGMIAGSLSAGVFYELSPTLPFIVGGSVFLLAAAAGAVNLRQYRNR